jgi:hypothetical protein
MTTARTLRVLELVGSYPRQAAIVALDGRSLLNHSTLQKVAPVTTASLAYTL